MWEPTGGQGEPAVWDGDENFDPKCFEGNAQLFAAAFESYRRNCADPKAANDDLLGQALDVCKEVAGINMNRLEDIGVAIDMARAILDKAKGGDA